MNFLIHRSKIYVRHVKDFLGELGMELKPASSISPHSEMFRSGRLPGHVERVKYCPGGNLLP